MAAKKKTTKKTTRRAGKSDKSVHGKKAEEIVETTVDTLHGDVTKLILEEIQAAPDVWSKMSQEKQEAAINRCRAKAETMIRRAVGLIAAQGFRKAPAMVESVTFKDGVKVVLKMHDRGGAHKCADQEGANITLVFADPDKFLHGDAFPEAEPDQGKLPINDGQDKA